MEILVRRNDLVKELQLVQGIVERKNSIPILQNVLAEARSGELRISATDLDVSLRSGCAAQVVEDGSVTLGAKKLYEIVRSLPESDVSVKVERDAWAKIRCERVEIKMAGLPGEDFPTLPEARPAKAIDVPVGVLRALIQRTAFAITAEDARYYLAGALLVLDKEAAAMVATDGHRLAWAQKRTVLKLADATRVLVPRKAITELARLVEDMGDEETVSFQQGDG
ncbi:MAG: DNA polymerase III subunit beta, partial [Planctomycetota bacterium]